MRDEIYELAKSLRIFDTKVIGEVAHARKWWGSPHSGRTNSQKHLNALVDLGLLVRGQGFYRVPECKSEYDDHARLLTASLARILKVFEAEIYREHSVPIGFRADAIVLLKNGERAKCFVLEVAHTETHDSLRRKMDAWLNWKGGKDYLTQLFGYDIPQFGFVIEGKEVAGANKLSDI